MIGITFNYNIGLENRDYFVGEIIQYQEKKYRVRKLGESFVVFLEPVVD